MFDIFVKKAIWQDSRNRFEAYDRDLSLVPDDLRPLYIKYNPIDVEVKMNDAYVHFYPVEELAELQEEYDLGNDCFVFATSDGEPIYLRNGKVFTCIFGSGNTKEYRLYENIYDFFDAVE